MKSRVWACLCIGLAILGWSETTYGQQTKVVKKKTRRGKDYYEVKVGAIVPTMHGSYRKEYRGEDVIKGQYQNGLKEGKWTYTDNGRIQYEEFYHLDTLKQTYTYLKNNVIKAFYQTNGTIRVEFDNPLNTKIERTIKDDTVWYFNPDNSIAGKSIKGIKVGSWDYRLHSGHRAKMEYNKGRKIGAVQTFYPSQNKLMSYTLDDSSKFHGMRLFFRDKTNDTLGLYNYVHGALDGPCWTKYSNGHFFCTAEYDSGRLMEYREFDRSGNMVDSSKIVHGKGRIFISSMEEDERTVKASIGLLDGYFHGEVIYFSSGESKTVQYLNGIRSDDKDGESTPTTVNRYAYSWLKTADSANFSITPSKYTAGDMALDIHIDDEYEISELAYSLAESGTLLTNFTVDQIGRLEDFSFANKHRMGLGLEESLIRTLLLTSGTWTPAIVHGEPVRMRFSKPVRLNFN